MASPRTSLIPLMIPPFSLTRQLLPSSSTSTSLAPRFLYHTTTTPTHLLLRPAFPLPPPPPFRLYARYQKHKYSTSPPTFSPKPYTFEEIQSLLPTTTTTNNPPTSNPQHSAAAAAAPHQRTRIIIDVREPAEVQSTGRIPGAYNMPLTSNPDAFYLGAEDFFERFGFEKPRRTGIGGGGGVGVRVRRGEEEEGGGGRGTRAGVREGEAESGVNAKEGGEEEEEEETGVEEVVFYCKAGVRSRAAARMAREWVGIKVGDMTGGWMEWEKKGGQIER